MTFAQYYAENYNCSLESAERRIEMAVAMRPHVEALTEICRERYAVMIDRSASELRRADSLEAYVWRGRALECSEFPGAFAHHIEMIDALADEYGRRLEEEANESSGHR